jgi:hypothetical protein
LDNARIGSGAISSPRTGCCESDANGVGWSTDGRKVGSPESYDAILNVGTQVGSGDRCRGPTVKPKLTHRVSRPAHRGDLWVVRSILPHIARTYLEELIRVITEKQTRLG